MNESWADYLRRAMTDAGYDPDGVRSGGRTRLAEDSGVSLPVISRSLNEGRTPDPSTLRALAGPLRKTYRELLIKAGHATEEDLPDPAQMSGEGSLQRSPVGRSGDPDAVLALDDMTPEQRAEVRRFAEFIRSQNPGAR